MSVRVTTREDDLGPWYVSWTGIWIGALAAFALLLVFGLTGVAIGAHQLGKRIASWHDFRLITLAFSVFGSFLSFALGGWAVARIAGIRRAENAMLHGAIVWLVAIPFVLFFAALGAGGFLGSWYAGLAAPPAWTPPATPTNSAEAIAVARNSALGAITALLLGLMGGVIGGWMGSGERMTLTYAKRAYGRVDRAWGESR